MTPLPDDLSQFAQWGIRVKRTASGLPVFTDDAGHEWSINSRVKVHRWRWTGSEIVEEIVFGKVGAIGFDEGETPSLAWKVGVWFDEEHLNKPGLPELHPTQVSLATL